MMIDFFKSKLMLLMIEEPNVSNKSFPF